MYTNDFCLFLEFHLSKCLFEETDPEIKGFWCDGVDYNGETDQQVIGLKRVKTIAYLGKSGQEPYTMIINFGNRSIDALKNRTPLEHCVPEEGRTDWYVIDLDEKEIELFLR